MIEDGHGHYTKKLERLQERENQFYKILDNKTHEYEKKEQVLRIQKLKDLDELKEKENNIG